MQRATSPELILRVFNNAARLADPTSQGPWPWQSRKPRRESVASCTPGCTWRPGSPPPAPASSCFLRGVSGSAGERAQRNPAARWFSFFLFCQTECEFALGTSQAKRQWFGLLVSTGGRSTPLPPSLGAELWLRVGPPFGVTKTPKLSPCLWVGQWKYQTFCLCQKLKQPTWSSVEDDQVSFWLFPNS